MRVHSVYENFRWWENLYWSYGFGDNAEGAMNAAINYSKEREQFGKTISKFQGVSFKLADMATEIEASRLLLYKAASQISNAKKSSYFSAIAKYKALSCCFSFK